MAHIQTPDALSPAGYVDFSRRRTFGSVMRKTGALARRNKLGAFGVVLVIIVLAMAIMAPLIQRYDDNESFQTANPKFNPTANPLDIANDPGLGSPYILDRWESPLSSKHWLGTDQLGRDIYARIVVGARLAVIIGVGASLIAVVLGTVVGLFSGYFGGKLDLFLQRFVDGIQAFPGLVLLLLIVSVMDQPSLALTVIALGVLGFATSVRIVRSSVLAVSQATYIEAARSYGATSLRIMLQHVLPNILSAILIVFSISIGAYILAEASLSFLGLGVPLPTPSWGNVLQDARSYLTTQPWAAVGPGVFLAAASLSFQFMSDGLRDVLDHRS